MSRFSTPDEIFGPVSIKKLKIADKYERVIRNYLPSAEVVFLDEIWKAGPSIQNALLTILNEKKFRNGEREIDVPIKALISASNELPVKMDKEQGQSLEAIWDRFLLRLVVGVIEDPEKFNKMIKESSDPFKDKMENIDENDKITKNDYKEWSEKIAEIKIPDNVINVIGVVRDKIRKYNEDNKENVEKQIYVSDRRWQKIVRLMRASAFVNDRIEIDLMDCFLIKHCIWNEKSQIDTVWQFVSGTIEEYGYTKEIDFKDIEDELDNFRTEIDEETKFEKDTRVKVLEPVHNDYYEILNPPDQNSNLISKDEFKNLSNQNKNMYLSYWYDSYQRVQNYYTYNIRKGNSKYSIFINDKEYKLKTMTQGEKRQTTKKPHQVVEKNWDEHVDVLLLTTGDMKAQIEEYRNKDLEHLRTNLFVEPELANIVETHINEVQKNIEKIEVEIGRIQHGYKQLKDEEIVLQ
jgi:MoxR-like ATPase